MLQNCSAWLITAISFSPLPVCNNQTCPNRCSAWCGGSAKLCNKLTVECLNGCQVGYTGAVCDKGSCWSQEYQGGVSVWMVAKWAIRAQFVTKVLADHKSIKGVWVSEWLPSGLYGRGLWQRFLLITRVSRGCECLNGCQVGYTSAVCDKGSCWSQEYQGGVSVWMVAKWAIRARFVTKVLADHKSIKGVWVSEWLPSGLYERSLWQRFLLITRVSRGCECLNGCQVGYASAVCDKGSCWLQEYQGGVSV